ncbi:MAG: DUF3078 domain-containing protein [Barnesiella sp.]|nr:DUF3078 domain-containing protein [Barnesiella sp.]MBD5257686.1 DUF3078 domain-containing protein [Barnesiella sp.]
MLTRLRYLLMVLVLTCIAAGAQVTKKYKFVNGQWIEEIVTEVSETLKAPVDTLDEDWVDYADLYAEKAFEIDTTLDVRNRLLPSTLFMPMIFDGYDVNLIGDSVKIEAKEQPEASPLDWVNDRMDAINRYNRVRQRYMVDNVNDVKYNINTLPEAPKRFHGFVDPNTAKITVEEIAVDKSQVKGTLDAVKVKKIHWLQQFDGLVQFSQAYNSPNWYQGGNNNLNTIIQGVYQGRLNQAFHPNLLFENTVQYKLGLNSAPDDSLRNYSISEDNFQINSKFGVRAAKRWYYSATMQFKTQLLNNYRTNTRDLSAAFLSPGEFNLGLGLTYEYSTPSGNFKTNASLAPLSYNLKICTNEKIDERQFGIKEGHTSVSQYGSNVDCSLEWKLAYNISFRSRLTAFTNYDYLQGDWENTLSFSINRFLSTQVYVHIRYDSTTRRYEDTDWHKWQIREVLSFGFAYKLGRL